MKALILALLFPFLAYPATILPGSWIEAHVDNGMAYNLQADDGFYIAGGIDFTGFSNNSSEDLSHIILSWLGAVSGTWGAPGVAGGTFSSALDDETGTYAYFMMNAPETPLVEGSTPFTFEGHLVTSWNYDNPAYEFTGQGTAYFNDIISNVPYPYAESVRYEFEAAPQEMITHSPEPGTWLLMLTGFAAIVMARRRRG